ncbi:MAG: hypothetical protein E6G68_00825 [Actinobacteria bacterium]|nr:MAG: hypothetical protein E6G68_00825 [Actinomycetota bacterium]
MSDSTGRARRNNGSISGANGRVVGVLLDRRAQAKLLKGRDREKMGSMIGKQAFDVLGIAPTDDGREIRAAFLRLARIYHPDRFAGLPEDVRVEAERRMKEATAAYEKLRARTPSKPVSSRKESDEIKRRARQYRDAIEAKRSAEEKDRARWRRWDEVELRAKQKAALEADLAARISEEVNGVIPDEDHPIEGRPPTPLDGKGGAKRDSLGQRLDAARRGETAPLAVRRAR